MHGQVRRLIFFLSLLFGCVASAFAADTGTLSGVVFERGGEPVADASVRIFGDGLPVARTVQTGANGMYRFEYLLPGEYTIEIEKAGVGTARRTAVVEVERDTQVDAVIGLTVREEITVSAARPIVDTRSAAVGFNFTSNTLSALPLERTYRGLFQLLPGVADNRSVVGPAGGGSRQDNTYLVDGANITNPLYGYLSTEVSELDLAEVNVKRAGISAEFGRASGSVINAVSRSGSNQLSGIGRIEWLPEGLVSAYKLPDDLLRAGVRPGVFRDPMLTTQTAVALGVGGPVLTDHIFFYGSARRFRETKWDRFNKLSDSLPDEVRTGPELYGKITAIPTESQQVTISYRHRPNHVDNAGIGADFAPSVATTRDNGSGIGTAEWARFFSGRRSLNVRYLFMRELNEDAPVRDLGYLPPFNPNNLSAMGQFTDPSQANLTVGANQFTSIQNYRRHDVRASFSQIFEAGRTGHVLKAGIGYDFADEQYDRVANGWGSITTITQSGVPALRARYFTPQSPQIGQANTSSIFVQDDVTFGTRVSANLGVLLNRDEFSQYLRGSSGCPSTITLKGGAAVYESSGDTCHFLRFGFGDEIQPRLGLSYQIRDGKGDKAYVNWGRYYNMDQKSSARSLAPTRIYQTQTIFDYSGNVLSSGPLASTTGKMIDPEIKPIYTDEVLVGYATPFRDVYGIDVFFMARRMKNFIEDVPSRISGPAADAGPYVAANLPCTAFASCRSADAKRTYRAFVVDVRRRMSGNWMTDVSYAWSRFEGNFDLDYSSVLTSGSVFNTSSFIQDAPGTNVEDPNRFGPLFEDRPHVFKAFASYAPTARITTAAYLRVQSGTPWAARGRDWTNAVLNYLEPAGSHRNPTWTNIDLMAGYRLPLSSRANITFEARLLNVFDNQTRLSTDAQQFLDLRTVATPPYFQPYLQPNPFFATGSSFAPPRRVYLTAVVTF